MITNNNFDLFKYIIVTDRIVSGFFNSEKEYQPHYGMVQAMAIYYAECVVSSEFDESCPHNTEDILKLAPILSDESFIDAFNQALSETEEYRFNFAHAYQAALQIVESKVNSYKTIGGSVAAYAIELIEKIGNLMTQENIDKITSIAEDISSGNIDYYKLMDMLKDSKLFDDIIGSDDNDTKDNVDQGGDNIVPFSEGN